MVEVVQGGRWDGIKSCLEGVDHLPLRVVEEVVDEVLLPALDPLGLECADPHDEHPHVQHRDLRPRREGRVSLAHYRCVSSAAITGKPKKKKKK